MDGGVPPLSAGPATNGARLPPAALCLRVILLDAIGAPLSALFNIEQTYCCLNIIDYFPDLAVVRLLNGGVNGAPT